MGVLVCGLPLRDDEATSAHVSTDFDPKIMVKGTCVMPISASVGLGWGYGAVTGGFSIVRLISCAATSRAVSMNAAGVGGDGVVLAGGAAGGGGGVDLAGGNVVVGGRICLLISASNFL